MFHSQRSINYSIIGYNMMGDRTEEVITIWKNWRHVKKLHNKGKAPPYLSCPGRGWCSSRTCNQTY